MHFFAYLAIVAALVFDASGQKCDEEQCVDDSQGLMQINEQMVKAARSSPPSESKEPMVPSESSHSVQLDCNASFGVFPYGYEETKRWGTNYHGWETCAEGKSQSPIDLRMSSL